MKQNSIQPATYKKNSKRKYLTIVLLLVLLLATAYYFSTQNNKQQIIQPVVSEDVEIPEKPIEEMSLQEVLSQNNEDQMNIVENSGLSVFMQKSETDEPAIILTISANNTPINAVESVISYDPEKTEIINISGTQSFSNTDNHFFDTNDEIIWIYAKTTDESPPSDDLINIANIEYEGDFSFQIQENRTFAVSGDTILDLKQPK